MSRELTFELDLQECVECAGKWKGRPDGSQSGHRHRCERRGQPALTWTRASRQEGEEEWEVRPGLITFLELDSPAESGWVSGVSARVPRGE